MIHKELYIKCLSSFSPRQIVSIENKYGQRLCKQRSQYGKCG